LNLLADANDETASPVLLKHPLQLVVFHDGVWCATFQRLIPQDAHPSPAEDGTTRSTSVERQQVTGVQRVADRTWTWMGDRHERPLLRSSVQSDDHGRVGGTRQRLGDSRRTAQHRVRAVQSAGEHSQTRPDRVRRIDAGRRDALTG
jgi:hypothetical protein